MSTIKDKALAPVNFVRRHRVAIAVVATTVVCYKAHVNVVKSTNEFLESKGLLEEFYALGEEV